jgi:hypothetical protein
MFITEINGIRDILSNCMDYLMISSHTPGRECQSKVFLIHLKIRRCRYERYQDKKVLRRGTTPFPSLSCDEIVCLLTATVLLVLSRGKSDDDNRDQLNSAAGSIKAADLQERGRV